MIYMHSGGGLGIFGMGVLFGEMVRAALRNRSVVSDSSEDVPVLIPSGCVRNAEASDSIASPRFDCGVLLGTISPTEPMRKFQAAAGMHVNHFAVSSQVSAIRMQRRNSYPWNGSSVPI